MAIRKLLGLAAILEGVTGLALMFDPSLVARFLFGDGVFGAGMALSRVAGITLLSLGVACWPGAEAAAATGPALRAMLTYNLLATIYLGYRGIGATLVGILLWPAVAVHAVLTFLLARVWLKYRQIK